MNTSSALVGKVYISEFMASNDSIMLGKPKGSYDWIELHNSSEKEVNLAEFFISNDIKNPLKTKLSGVISPNGYALFYASRIDSLENHLGFKLSKYGGELILSLKNQTELDRIRYGRQLKDISSVRTEKGWVYSDIPSPKVENNSDSYYSHLSQHVQGEFKIENGIQKAHLSAPNNQKIVYRILAKAKEKESYQTYENPIKLSPGEVIQAKLKGASVLKHKSAYFSSYNMSAHSLPVITISINPENLWNDENGIYMAHNCGNRGDDWSRPACIQYFHPDTCLTEQVNINIFGNASRSKPKKSFAFKAPSQIPNVFFKSVDEERIDGVIVRACHTGMTMYRNELIHDINNYLEGNMLMQEYQPAVLYINGEYWGVYNIMERKNRSFVKNHTGLEITGMVNAKNRQIAEVKAPSSDFQEALKTMNETSSSEQIYSILESTFRLEDLVDFLAHELILNRIDTYNNRFWKSKEENKWGVISFDYDLIFGRADNDKLIINYLQSEPNEGLKFLNKAFESEKFKFQVVKKICDFLNCGYQTHVIDSILQKYEEKTHSEFLLDTARWNAENKKGHLRELKSVKKGIYKFLDGRKVYLTETVFPFLGFDQKVILSIPEDFPGKVMINGYEVKGDLLYYTNMQFNLEVIPHKGIKFKGWSDGKEIIDISGKSKFSHAASFTPVYSSQ